MNRWSKTLDTDMSDVATLKTRAGLILTLRQANQIDYLVNDLVVIVRLAGG